MNNVPTEMGQISAAFIMFWMWTLHAGLRSAWWFFLRTLVVTVFCLLLVAKEGQFTSMTEWLAQWLATFHWIGVACVLIWPDPRFRRWALRG